MKFIFFFLQHLIELILIHSYVIRFESLYLFLKHTEQCKQYTFIEIIKSSLTNKMTLIFKSVLQVVCSVIVLLTGVADSAVICSEPTNLAEQYSQYMANATVSNMLEYLESSTAGGVASDEEEQLIYGNRICPSSIKAITTDPKSSVFERTTCPYFLVASHLSTRYPKIITEARCKCSGCVPLEENGHSDLTRCEPVYRPVRVLSRTGNCVNGVYQYTAAVHMKQEGCTCVRKTEALSGSGSGSNGSDDPIPM